MNLTDKLLHVPCTRAMLEGWHPEVLFEGSVRAIVIGPASDQEAALQADMDADAKLDDDPEAPDLSTYWRGNAWSILLIDPTHCLEDGDRTIAHTGELTFDLQRADCSDRVTRVLTGQPSHGRLHRRRPKGARTDRNVWLAFGPAAEWTYPLSLDRRFPSRVVVPEFTGLHPEDPSALPDGSRRVDRLALAAVARKVMCSEVRLHGRRDRSA